MKNVGIVGPDEVKGRTLFGLMTVGGCSMSYLQKNESMDKSVHNAVSDVPVGLFRKSGRAQKCGGIRHGATHFMPTDDPVVRMRVVGAGSQVSILLVLRWFVWFRKLKRKSVISTRKWAQFSRATKHFHWFFTKHWKLLRFQWS